MNDTSLKNPWGVVVRNGIWTAVNGSGTLNNYTLEGKFLQSVTVTATTGISSPSGLAKYSGFKFLITKGINTFPSSLVTVTENGTINAWHPSVDPLNALITFSDPTKVFKGCDFLNDMLYVTDFSGGFINTFDSSWNLINTFTDPSLTAIGFAPYGIKTIGEKLYVTFAKQDSAKHDGVIANGAGYVDVFNPDGTFFGRFANRDVLNEPWAVLPFKLFCHGRKRDVILIGNFGDGRILVYSFSGKFYGYLSDEFDNAFTIDGLWGIVANGEGLIVTAGINSEADGLISVIKYS